MSFSLAVIYPLACFCKTNQIFHSSHYQHFTAIMSTDASKDINRVAGGLKAAIHNPNVSAEAKAEAQTKLNALGVEEDRTDRKSVV